MASNTVTIEDGLGDHWTFFVDEGGSNNGGRITLVEANRIAYIEAWFGTKEYVARRLERDDLPGLAKYLKGSERVKLVGYISGMRVDESARGRGLGGALVDRILQAMKEIGIKKIFLHRNAERGKDDALKTFYSDHGFDDFQRVHSDPTPVMVSVPR
jgi:GNAT superfamily N-acetyltransferase